MYDQAKYVRKATETAQDPEEDLAAWLMRKSKYGEDGQDQPVEKMRVVGGAAEEKVNDDH